MRTLSLICCLLLLIPTLLFAQEEDKRTEQLTEIENARITIQTARSYLNEDPRKSIDLLKEAARNLKVLNQQDALQSPEEKRLYPQSYLMQGDAFILQESFDPAKRNFNIAQKLAKEIQDAELIAEAQQGLILVDSLKANRQRGKLGTIWRDTKEKTIGKTESGIKKGVDQSKVKGKLVLAREMEKKGNYRGALSNYYKANEMLRELDDPDRLADVQISIANLEEKLGNYPTAISYLKEARAIKGSSDSSYAALGTRIENLEAKLPKEGSVLASYSGAPPSKKEDSLLAEIQNFKDQPSLDPLSQTKLQLLQAELEKEQYKNQRVIAEKVAVENQRQLLEEQARNQEQDLQLAKAQQEKATNFRNNLILVLALVVGLLVALYFIYFNKQRAHRKLQSAFRELNETQSQLREAESRIKTLLTQQVSGAIAEKLITNPTENKVENRFVCIMFLDIRDFTPFAEKRTPAEIIRYQNDVFGFMIEIIEKHNGVINQFMGDGFMATFGAPESHSNDCLNAVLAAKEIVETVQQKSASEAIPHTRVGIGLHAGEVVTGNVGTENRMQYSITGNTVILAARIEQLNKQFQSELLISREVHDELPNPEDFPSDFREVQVKGRQKPVEILQLV